MKSRPAEQRDWNDMGKGFEYGARGKAMELHKYFFFLPLEEIHFRLRDPLDILNFVREHIYYNKDRDNYGEAEHWLTSVSAVMDVLESRSDDCDGGMVVLGSILYTLGHPIWHCVGHYGHRPERFVNHAWTMLEMPPWGITNPYLMETTGDEPQGKLQPIDSCMGYYPLLMASPAGEYRVCGDWV